MCFVCIVERHDHSVLSECNSIHPHEHPISLGRYVVKVVCNV